MYLLNTEAAGSCRRHTMSPVLDIEYNPYGRRVLRDYHDADVGVDFRFAHHVHDAQPWPGI